MNPLLLLLPVPIVIYLLGAARTNSALNKSQIIFRGVSVRISKGITILSPSFTVQNRSKIPMSFDGFVGKIFIDGNDTGLVNLKSPIIVPPGKDETITLQANLPLTATIKQLASLLVSKKLPSKGTIDGTIKVNNQSFPLKENFSFNKPTTNTTTK